MTSDDVRGSGDNNASCASADSGANNGVEDCNADGDDDDESGLSDIDMDDLHAESSWTNMSGLCNPFLFIYTYDEIIRSSVNIAVDCKNALVQHGTLGNFLNIFWDSANAVLMFKRKSTH